MVRITWWVEGFGREVLKSFVHWARHVMPCNGNNSTHLQLHMYIVFYDPSTILGHWYWWCFDSAHDFSSIQKYSTSFNFSKTGTSSSVKHLLPLQQCQGWARSPTPVYRGLNEFPSSQWTHVNTIETAARPEWQKVPWTNMFAAKSSLFPEVHPVQPIYTYIYISFYINLPKQRHWARIENGIHQHRQLHLLPLPFPCFFAVCSNAPSMLEELGSWLSQGMYFGMVSSLRRMSTVASPPNSCRKKTHMQVVIYVEHNKRCV